LSASTPLGPDDQCAPEGKNEDQTVSIRLLARSHEEPLREIVENAGEDAAVVLNAVRAGKGAYGYND
jgi:chaperonin GroEL